MRDLRDIDVETAAGETTRLGEFLHGTTLLLLPRFYG